MISWNTFVYKLRWLYFDQNIKTKYIFYFLGYYDYAEEGGVPTCPECLATFKNQGSLIHHMGVHRGETTCRVCGKVQSRVANLRRHMAKVHGVDMQLQPLVQPLNSDILAWESIKLLVLLLVFVLTNYDENIIRF